MGFDPLKYQTNFRANLTLADLDFLLATADSKKVLQHYGKVLAYLA